VCVVDIVHAPVHVYVRPVYAGTSTLICSTCATRTARSSRSSSNRRRPTNMATSGLSCCDCLTLNHLVSSLLTRCIAYSWVCRVSNSDDMLGASAHHVYMVAIARLRHGCTCMRQMCELTCSCCRSRERFLVSYPQLLSREVQGMPGTLTLTCTHTNTRSGNGNGTRTFVVTLE
jgi:hypothetical protein